MVESVVIAASAFAGATGFAFGSAAHELRCSSRCRGGLRRRLGVDSMTASLGVNLESDGFTSHVIETVLRASSVSEEVKPLPFAAMWAFRADAVCARAAKAGLESAVNKEGVVRARARFSLTLLAVGLLVGALFSPLLSGLLGFGAFVFGYSSISRSFEREAKSRSFVAERQLSQMIEVLMLGLRSGMSFDRSLFLYRQYFSGGLSFSIALAQDQWTHGLVERDTGLRALAESYDSPLFERMAEVVVRSLRFGTSLIDGLGVLAIEARSIRKAKLEEKIAKAPVKMLLPVGTLILPAMLILILGPILLDLMNGF